MVFKCVLASLMISTPGLADTCPGGNDRIAQFDELLDQIRVALDEIAATNLFHGLSDIWATAPDEAAITGLAMTLIQLVITTRGGHYLR